MFSSNSRKVVTVSALQDGSGTGRIESPTKQIQRLLRRAPPIDELNQHATDTTATLAVMLRVRAPSQLLLAVFDPMLEAKVLREVATSDLEVTRVDNAAAALARFTADRHVITVTDDLKLLPRLRAVQSARFTPILFIADADGDLVEALRAGADDIIAGRASSNELHARISNARRMTDLEGALRDALLQNRKLSTTDELTGVANRHFFSRYFPREISKTAREVGAIAVIMCDIDHFKRVNDTFGHAAGDAVLCEFGARLQANIRRGQDWIARLGGEEFIIVLPDTDHDQGLVVARKLRECIGLQPFVAAKQPIPVTASFGLCSVGAVGIKRTSIAQRILIAADKAMYHSKEKGRDRVTTVRFA